MRYLHQQGNAGYFFAKKHFYWTSSTKNTLSEDNGTFLPKSIFIGHQVQKNGCWHLHCHITSGSTGDTGYFVFWTLSTKKTLWCWHLHSTNTLCDLSTSGSSQAVHDTFCQKVLNQQVQKRRFDAGDVLNNFLCPMQTVEDWCVHPLCVYSALQYCIMWFHSPGPS